MVTIIKEAFEYLSENPGVLSLGERALIKSFQKYWKKRGELTQRQLRTLLEIRKYRDGTGTKI